MRLLSTRLASNVDANMRAYCCPVYLSHFRWVKKNHRHLVQISFICLRFLPAASEVYRQYIHGSGALFCFSYIVFVRVGTDVNAVYLFGQVMDIKPQMRANIVRLLHTSPGRVNVKARTHEKVDSVGEGRAMACHVVVLLEKIP